MVYIPRCLREHISKLTVHFNYKVLCIRKLVYEFSDENTEFSHDELSTLVQCTGLDEQAAERVISFLLYYGVLGVTKLDEDTIYIYDVNYDIEMLHVRIRKWTESTKYVVNRALWPALHLKPNTN